MARDLIYDLSPAELSKEITALTQADVRSLPPRSKVFAAIANLQEFDHLPEVGGIEEVNALIQDGAIELNRGICSTPGVPASIYAADLLRGPLYPGALAGIGNGIYCAVPVLDTATEIPIDAPPLSFPKLSAVALRHAACSRGLPSVIVRGALKKDARILTMEDVKELFQQHRNRAREAGITDYGSLAAAFGFDAFCAGNDLNDEHEDVWVVLNRTSVVFQKIALQRVVND